MNIPNFRKIKTYSLFFYFLFFILGFLFFIQKKIVYLPKFRPGLDNSESKNFSKKFEVYFYKNGWKSEKVSSLVDESKESVITSIVTMWCSVMQDEELIKNKISLQSVIISQNNIYLSFDQPLLPFVDAYSNFKFIAGLLKTLYIAGFSDFKVYFLVHHKVCKDMLLDFEVPWPTDLYLLDNN